MGRMFPVARATGNRPRFGDSRRAASRWKSSSYRRLVRAVGGAVPL